MTWTGARKATLPPDWPAIRRLVLERDGHRCTWPDPDERCTAPATDVDHIGDRHDHHPDNLRSLCGPHHDQRTAAQGVAARNAKRYRPQPPHPGLRGGGG